MPSHHGYRACATSQPGLLLNIERIVEVHGYKVYGRMFRTTSQKVQYSYSYCSFQSPPQAGHLIDSPGRLNLVRR
jgi:hypothetical protein